MFKNLVAVAQFLEKNVILSAPPKISACSFRFLINLQKGATFIYVFILMALTSNFSTGMWFYAGLHGTYGILWLLKDFTIPDARWNIKLTLGSAFCVSSLLLLYWVLPLTIALGQGIQYPSNERILICILVYGIGLILMFGSDTQKYYVLKLKKGLISDGFFSKTRNPNYLGEIMIYGSFAIATGHWLSYCILTTIWCVAFACFIILKEDSLRRKEGWKNYKNNSLILLPRIFQTYLYNHIFYIILFSLIWGIYRSGGITSLLLKFSLFLLKIFQFCQYFNKQNYMFAK